MILHSFDELLTDIGLISTVAGELAVATQVCSS